MEGFFMVHGQLAREFMLVKRRRSLVERRNGRPFCVEPNKGYKHVEHLWC